MTNIEIAKEIISQLGGNKFSVMTGAKDFVAIENGVQFRIGKNATRCNLVKVILTPMDDYIMQFWHIPGIPSWKTIVKYGMEEIQKRYQPKMLKSVDGVYCDTIQEVFTEYTHLYTRLF